MKRKFITEKLAGMVFYGMLAGTVLLSGCATTKREITPLAPVDNTNSFFERGNSYFKKGDLERALSYYNKIIETNPGFGPAYLSRANAYFRKGLYDEALSDYNQVIQMDPQCAEAYKKRGIIHNNKNETDLAIRDFNRAIAVNPRDADLYVNRGDAYFRRNMYDGAIADYDKAVMISPKHAEAYFRKAVTCELGGRRNEAAEAYTHYLQYASPHSSIKIGRARERIRVLQKGTVATMSSGAYKSP